MREGVLLGERYQLEDRIAVGGMGEVWRGRDDILGRPVAIKLLKAEYASDPAFLERFRAEARNTARLSHPGIATVYDYGEVPGGRSAGSSAYLVMELVRGEPLSAVLARRKRLSAEETLDLVAQTAAALQEAHREGVVHRDIKPGNLMVADRGPQGAAVIKVTDFGIARATDAVPLTQTGTVLGTAWYLSPEQASGEEAGPASDIYSLGVVAYECLAGRRPFDGPTPVAVLLAHQRDTPAPLPTDVPRGVRELVARAMARRPEDRPIDAGDLSRGAFRLREALLAGRTNAVAGLAVTRGLADAPTATRPLGPGGRTAVLPSSTPTRSLGAARPAAASQPRRLGAPAPPRRPAGPPVPPAPLPRSSGPRRGSLRVPLLGLLALLALVVVAIVANRGTSSRQGTAQPSVSARPSSAPSTATRSAAPTVQVNASSYVGERLSRVRSALAAKGLGVQVSGSELPRATVTAVSPRGSVAAGSTITVSTIAPSASPTTAPTTAAPTPSASAAPSGTATAGSTNGNSKKGKGSNG